MLNKLTAFITASGANFLQTYGLIDPNGQATKLADELLKGGTSLFVGVLAALLVELLKRYLSKLTKKHVKSDYDNLDKFDLKK